MLHYELTLNGSYLNSFASYTQARNEADRLRALHPNWNIEVISVDK